MQGVPLFAGADRIVALFSRAVADMALTRRLEHISAKCAAISRHFEARIGVGAPARPDAGVDFRDTRDGARSERRRRRAS
jgi:hypothetical protein